MEIVAYPIYYKIKEDEDFNEIAPLSDPLTRQPILGTDGKQLEILLEDLEEISPNRDERKLASQAKFFLRLPRLFINIRISLSLSNQPCPFPYSPYIISFKETVLTSTFQYPGTVFRGAVTAAKHK